MNYGTGVELSTISYKPCKETKEEEDKLRMETEYLAYGNL